MTTNTAPQRGLGVPLYRANSPYPSEQDMEWVPAITIVRQGWVVNEEETKDILRKLTNWLIYKPAQRADSHSALASLY